MVAFFFFFFLVVCSQLFSMSSQESFRADPVDNHKSLKVSRLFSSFFLVCSWFHFLKLWCVEDFVDMAVWEKPRFCRPLTILYIQQSALQITSPTAAIVQLRVARSPLVDVDSRSDVSFSEAPITQFDQTKITTADTTLSSGRCSSFFAWYYYA